MGKALPDVGRPGRLWWKRNGPTEMAKEATILQALSDVNFLALGHLAKRMADKKTPVEVKDAIALAMAPKLMAEFRGRLPVGGGGGGGTPSGSEPADGVLAAYRIRS